MNDHLLEHGWFACADIGLTEDDMESGREFKYEGEVYKIIGYMKSHFYRGGYCVNSQFVRTASLNVTTDNKDKLDKIARILCKEYSCPLTTCKECSPSSGSYKIAEMILKSLDEI